MERYNKDRVVINVVPSVIGVVMAVGTAVFAEKQEANDIVSMAASTMLDVWGILLGFMIAAVSVLITFKDGFFISMLKKTGHYKTILLAFVYCCFHLFIGVAFSMFLTIYQVENSICYYLICGLAIDTIVIVGECLYFLLKIVKTMGVE